MYKKKIPHPGRWFTKPVVFMTQYSLHSSQGPKREKGTWVQFLPSWLYLIHILQAAHQSRKWNTFIWKVCTPPRILKSLLPRIYPQQVVWRKSIEHGNFCSLENAVGREGFERYTFLAWVKAKVIIKPRAESLLQPLNFKRKWLQIPFARDAICFS